MEMEVEVEVEEGGIEVEAVREVEVMGNRAGGVQGRIIGTHD